MKVYLTSLAVIALIAVAGFRMVSPGGLMGFKYESTVVLQVHPSMIAISPVRSGPQRSTLTRNYIESEFEVIPSTEVLSSAIQAIALDTRWDQSPEETLETLRPLVSAEPRRGTDFIEIKVQSHNEEDAKDIANAVADAHIAHRNAIEIERAEVAIEALDEELAKHADIVKEKQVALTTLIQSYGIPYFDGRTSSGGMTEEKMYRHAHERLDQLLQDRDLLKIQISKFVETEKEDLVPAVAGLELPENQVATFYNQYIETLRKDTALTKQGHATNHPERVTLAAKAAQQMADAEKALVPLRDVLNTQINLIDRQVERMETTILKKRITGMGAPPGPFDHYSTPRDQYEQSRDLLRQMKIQQQEQRALLKIPRTPVTRHE